MCVAGDGVTLIGVSFVYEVKRSPAAAVTLLGFGLSSVTSAAALVVEVTLALMVESPVVGDVERPPSAESIKPSTVALDSGGDTVTRSESKANLQ